MKTSAKGLALIKTCEGFRSAPYLCPAGVPTIGYGSTRYADSRAVTLHDSPITEAAAETLLRTTLAGYEDSVAHLLQRPVTQGQFDALVDFAYNLGVGALRGSTLLKKVNAGDTAGAAGEFAKWVHANGEVLPGLVKRRAAEAVLFTSA